MQLSSIGMPRTITTPATTPAATALPRPGAYGGGLGFDYSTPDPQPEKSSEDQLRQAQLELIQAQKEAAEAVADAARASQRHWWN
jgi:hypothetical protein